MNAKREDANPTAHGRRGWLLWAAALLIAAFALVAGFTVAWLYNGQDIQTLLPLQPPAKIALYEPDQDTSLGPISVSGTASETESATQYKVFRVKTGGDFKLEIAHTTNLQGLQFKIYPATPVTGNQTEQQAEDAATTNNSKTVEENGKTYSYNESSLLTGDYINATVTPAPSAYAEANSDYHSNNYGSYPTGSANPAGAVQKHAEALYWLIDSVSVDDSHQIYKDSNMLPKEYEYYYVCEITWTETANKETDLFYIMTKLAGDSQTTTPSQGG